MAYEIDEYLLKNPHPNEVKNNQNEAIRRQNKRAYRRKKRATK